MFASGRRAVQKCRRGALQKAGLRVRNIRFRVRILRTISRNGVQYLPARKAEPNRRLSLLGTVSSGHRCVQRVSGCLEIQVDCSESWFQDCRFRRMALWMLSIFHRQPRGRVLKGGKVWHARQVNHRQPLPRPVGQFDRRLSFPLVSNPPSQSGLRRALSGQGGPGDGRKAQSLSPLRRKGRGFLKHATNKKRSGGPFPVDTRAYPPGKARRCSHRQGWGPTARQRRAIITVPRFAQRVGRSPPRSACSIELAARNDNAERYRHIGSATLTRFPSHCA